MAQKILGVDLLKQVAQALGVEPDCVQRIVLDIDINDAVRAYVQLIGTDRLFDVVFSGTDFDVRIFPAPDSEKP